MGKGFEAGRNEVGRNVRKLPRKKNSPTHRTFLCKLEPTISALGEPRLIHWANRASLEAKALGENVLYINAVVLYIGVIHKYLLNMYS